MTTFADVYGALANGPLFAVGLRAHPRVPDEGEWPAAYVLPPVVDYEGMSSGFLSARVDVFILVSAALDKNQDKLLPYQELEGPSSVIAAMKADPSLGFSDVNVIAIRSRPMHVVEQSDYRAFGAVVELTVWIG